MSAGYEPRKMIVYVTKYWSTKGVYLAKVEDCFDTNPHMVKETKDYGQCLHKNDWFMTTEAAREYVEAKRVIKIASLEKQLAKIKKLDPFKPLHPKAKAGE